MYYRIILIVSTMIVALTCSTLIEAKIASEVVNTDQGQTGTNAKPGLGLITLDNGRLAYRQLLQAKRSIKNEDAANARFFLRQADDFLVALTQGRETGPVLSLTRIAQQRIQNKGRLSNDMARTLIDEGNDVLKNDAPELKQRADKAVAMAQSKAQGNDLPGATKALGKFYDIIAFRVDGKTMERVRQDIASAQAALRPDNTGPTLWQGATVAVNSALEQLDWINTRAGSQLLKARDLVYSALLQQGENDNAARQKIAQANARFELVPSFDKLSGLATQIADEPTPERSAINQLLVRIDKQIARLANESHSHI